MKICKGVSASPGLVLGQVSRLERHVETFSTGPFDPERELRQLEDAVRTAQSELDSMAERAASTEQAILQFQSMMLDDEGMMNEVRFCIKAGISAAAAILQDSVKPHVFLGGEQHLLDWPQLDGKVGDILTLLNDEEQAAGLIAPPADRNESVLLGEDLEPQIPGMCICLLYTSPSPRDA